MFHVVLTRFNIASPGREVAIRNSPGWLDRRFELFERYCLPSMAGQANRDFRWIIFFDKDTPDIFKERVERDREIFPFEPHYVGVFAGSNMGEVVRPLVPADETMILTTRFDNDDAVSTDFINRIQQAARGQPAGTVLNFTNGIAMRDGRLYHASDRSNPFTTLVEHEPSRVETIWAARHHELGAKFSIQQVGGKPVWLQVVHDENVTNRIKGSLVGDTAVLDGFRLRGDVEVVRPARIDYLIDTIVSAPIRRFREAAFKAIKPLFVKIRGE